MRRVSNNGILEVAALADRHANWCHASAFREDTRPLTAKEVVVESADGMGYGTRVLLDGKPALVRSIEIYQLPATSPCVRLRLLSEDRKTETDCWGKPLRLSVTLPTFSLESKVDNLITVRHHGVDLSGSLRAYHLEAATSEVWRVRLDLNALPTNKENA